MAKQWTKAEIEAEIERLDAEIRRLQKARKPAQSQKDQRGYWQRRLAKM